MTHPYYAFTEAGYQVEIVSPDGGKLEIDGFSDPDDSNGYSEEDLISRGFLQSLKYRALIEQTKALKDINPQEYDALLNQFYCAQPLQALCSARGQPDYRPTTILRRGSR